MSGRIWHKHLIDPKALPWRDALQAYWSALHGKLPPTVRLSTLERWLLSGEKPMAEISNCDGWISPIHS